MPQQKRAQSAPSKSICVWHSDVLLDGAEHCTTQRLWKLDWREIRLAIQVVLAALVDHTQLIMRGGGSIGQDLVDLAAFERHFLAFVLQAEDQQPSCGHTRNPVEAGFDLLLPAADSGCFVPMEFGAAHRTAGEANARDAFPFPPAASSEPPLQSLDFADGVADRELSTRVIGPMISKSTQETYVAFVREVGASA